MPATTPLREMLATVEIIISLITKAPYIILSIRNKTAHNAQFGYAGFCPF